MKRYMGNGVYVEFDGQIVLTTENNRIVLYLGVVESLVQFIQAIGQARPPREQVTSCPHINS